MKHFSFEGIRTLSEHNWIMDRILVRPSGPLSGDVTIKGAKNSALKLMAACTLTEGTFRLNNVPDIPSIKIKGKKTATKTKVVEIMAKVILFEPLKEATNGVSPFSTL